MLKSFIATMLFLTSACLQASNAYAAPDEKPQTIDIFTDEWLPYVNSQDAPLSDDMVLINLIAMEAGFGLNWRYFPFGASYDLVKSGKPVLSFPYFKTPRRTKEVEFSEPILKVVSQLYFNRQFHDANDFGPDLGQYRVGKVAGYSYGEQLDKLTRNAVDFSSERNAIKALLNNQIDILPITEEVADATLNQYFPNRRLLIQTVPLDQPYEPTELFLIAPKTDWGRKITGRIDDAITALTKRGVISVTTRELQRDRQPDFAELMTSEGYPVILGQTHEDEEKSNYYTLPNGTQVLVLEWSKRILQVSHTDRLYKNMVDLSRVLVLNGPHVGKELFVKNMHIHLR